MAVITEEMLPPEEQAKLAPRRTLSLPTLSLPIVAPSRAALMSLAAIGIAFGPEPWLRSLCAVAVALVVYVAGLRDGRAEVALDALLRGNVRPSHRAPRNGADTEGD